MAWIKVEHTTPLKPEVLRIARTLGITRDDAFGKVVRFWMWLDTITVDGDVDGIVDSDVDSVVGVAGFANALKSVSWLEIDDETQTLRVPNFTLHNGESAKKRAEKSKNQSTWRKNKAERERDDVDSDVDTTRSTERSTREDKRREDKAIPDGIASPEPSEEPLLTFPITGPEGQPKEWHLVQSLVDDLQAAYPAVDILAEARKSLAWIKTNPTRKKTFNGMPKYLNTWMAKEQDRGGQKSHNGNGQSASNGHKPRTGPKVLTEEDCEIINKFGEQEFYRLKGTVD